MGICDLSKNQNNSNGTTVNKNTFQQEYIVGKGGYGKVY